MARAKAKTNPVAQLPRPQAIPIKGEILPPVAARGVAKRETSSRFKFTKTAVERLVAPDPSGKQKLYWDEELTGFGVLVSGVTTSKSFIVQRKLGGVRTRRVTIGATNAMELGTPYDLAYDPNGASNEKKPRPTAYGRAKHLLVQFFDGIDPKTARREAARAADGQRTLQAALDSYLTDKRKKGGGELREKTKKDYRACVERHLSDWLDGPLREITPEMILERHKEIKNSVDLGEKKNAKRSVKLTGEATANGVMVALRAIWNFNANPGRVRDLPPNPVRALDTWFSTKRRTRLVEDKDLPAFYEAVDKLASRAGSDYLKLLLFTGFRRREAAQLEWDHLDFDARAIHLPESMTKTGQPLDLPMTDFVYDLLTARRELGREGKYVFAANGRHGYIQEPKFFLSQVAKATGIRISPHDLRRGYITVAESTDVPFLALKALVNHSASGGVTGGYVVMTVERLREPAQRVADKIKQLCGMDKPTKSRPKKLART